MQNNPPPPTAWRTLVQTLASRYRAHRRNTLPGCKADLRTWSLHCLRDIQAPEHVVRAALQYQEAESYEQSKARLYWGGNFLR